MRCAGVLLVACVVFQTAAQEFRGTITGRVTDGQDAAIPAAKVAAVQIETGSRSDTVTSTDGQYTLPYLAPGRYRLTAEADGFKRYIRAEVEVSPNVRTSLDFQLELGQLAETVTVTAETPLLETATASTGQVLNQRQVELMPLNGRSPLVLAQLAFGVISNADPRQARPYDDGRQSNFSMGGAPASRNELLLDGAPDSNESGRIAFSPPVDSVTEVKVETFQADAAYGHTGGGTVNLITKSGTNSFHGTAYEFNQVSRLAANQFFTNRSGQKKPVNRYNQWGLTAGGPVILPRLFDGRNKLFFFFAYEGIRTGLPRPTTFTVPTPAERRGDFSALLANGSSYQIYDPLTAVREGTRVRRQPFSGNIVPPERIHPISKRLLDLWPMPNQPGRSDGRDNFLSNYVNQDKFHSETGRLDWNANSRHKLFFNIRHNLRTLLNDDFLGNIASGIALNNFNWGTTVDHVASISPTLVLNTRGSWTRSGEVRNTTGDGFDFTTLGFPPSLAAESARMMFPVFTVGSFARLGGGNNVMNPFDMFQLFSTAMKSSGSHSLKFGVDLRLRRFNSISWGNAGGSYNFGDNWTRGPLDNSPSAPIGQDFAAFLLGLPTGGSFDLNAHQSIQAGYMSFFIQDDYRPTRDLTLNLGLRVERDLPTTERYNRSVNGFDFTTLSPVSAAASAAYDRNPIPEIPRGQFRAPGGLLFAGPENRTLFDTQTNFSPRFGFAWKPGWLGSGTVLRGGTGLYYFPLGHGGLDQTGFSQSTPVVPTQDGYMTPYSTLGNPFPDGIIRPTGSSLGTATYLGRGVGFLYRDRTNAYSIRWNFGIQRELGWRTVLEAGYFGNHAVHLAVSRELDFVPREYYSTSPDRDQAVIDRMTANVTNPFAGLLPGTNLNGNTVQRNQLLRPYPHFTGLTERSVPEGSSYFHMYQMRLEKRFSKGFQFLANYLWSKLMERQGRLNEADPFLEKVISGDDRPHRFVFSGAWDMPFLRAKTGWKRWAGGWNLAGIYTWQPGPPIGWGNVIYYGGDINLDPRGVDGAFDTSRFNRNPNQQLQWNLRTFPSRFSDLRADALNNFDLSVIKNTHLTESINLQYRCEFFNALNRAMFLAPNTQPTNTNFATINGQENLSRSIQMALRLVW